MALVNVVNMTVLDNPTNFQNPFSFEITFECLQELDDDLEWKVIYVGKAEDSKSDIVLDEILVGPVPVGMNKFLLQADAPTVGGGRASSSCRRLDEDHVLGVTVVLVTCSFREREFVRVGYYVNNEYTGEYADGSGGGEHGGGAPPPPKPLDLNLVTRQILADKPRVTKFPIPWGDNNNNNNNNANDGTEQGDVMEGERGKEGLMEGNGGVVSPSFSPHEQQQQQAAAAVGGGGGGEVFAAPTVSSE
jgi:histone chaperone ASF1